jgi:hypothetical protein
MRLPGLILVLALGTSPLLAQERQEESALLIPDSLQSRNSSVCASSSSPTSFEPRRSPAQAPVR